MTTNVLQRPTLVLNQNWQAVNIRPVMRAIVKVFSGNAKVVDPETYATFDWNEWSKLRPTDGDFTINCVGGEIRVPEIITLKGYSKIPSRVVSFSRRNLYLRDKYTCQYCGVKLQSSEITIDHITPKARGGQTTWENCVVACVGCNHKKADKIPRDVGMKLLSKPGKPRWSPAFQCKLRIPSWEKFVSAMYWNVELEK